MSAAIGGALRWATTKVDENVVAPVTSRIATSVANPYVLSYFIWERIKQMTPQRARDLTRLLSTAIANAVGVVAAPQAQQLRASTQQLQEELLEATAAPVGKDVLLNGVAMLAKTAQALNTPETRIATSQAFETLQSVFDFFASPQGRKVVATTGACLTQFCDVAASPEATILLAEVATNVCHALEAEVERMKEKKGAASKSKDDEKEKEKEKNAVARPSQRQKERKRADRSARIEKAVLLRMGVAPEMVQEIQRVLDAVAEEEAAVVAHGLEVDERKDMILEDMDVTDVESEEEENGESDDLLIARAFGLRTADAPPAPPAAPALDQRGETTATAEEEKRAAAEVILPEWHTQDTRAALRQRHTQLQSSMDARDPSGEQGRHVAEALGARQPPVEAIDLAVTRAITRVVVYFIIVLLLAATLLLLMSAVRS